MNKVASSPTGWVVYYDTSTNLLRIAPARRDVSVAMYRRFAYWFQTEDIALRVHHWRKVWLKDMKRWGKERQPAWEPLRARHR